MPAIFERFKNELPDFQEYLNHDTADECVSQIAEQNEGDAIIWKLADKILTFQNWQLNQPLIDLLKTSIISLQAKALNSGINKEEKNHLGKILENMNHILAPGSKKHDLPVKQPPVPTIRQEFRIEEKAQIPTTPFQERFKTEFGDFMEYINFDYAYSGMKKRASSLADEDRQLVAEFVNQIGSKPEGNALVINLAEQILYPDHLPLDEFYENLLAESVLYLGTRFRDKNVDKDEKKDFEKILKQVLTLVPSSSPIYSLVTSEIDLMDYDKWQPLRANIGLLFELDDYKYQDEIYDILREPLPYDEVQERIFKVLTNSVKAHFTTTEKASSLHLEPVVEQVFPHATHLLVYFQLVDQLTEARQQLEKKFKKGKELNFIHDVFKNLGISQLAIEDLRKAQQQLAVLASESARKKKQKEPLK